jgi:acyl-CoA thioesterase YciA
LINLKLWAKDLVEEFDQQRHLMTEAVFRYVAIGEDRRPRRIPDNARYPRSGDSNTLQRFKLIH